MTCEICGGWNQQHDQRWHAMAERLAKLEAAVSKAMQDDLGPRLPTCEEWCGELRPNTCCDDARVRRASGQLASARETVPAGWKLAPGWSTGPLCHGNGVHIFCDHNDASVSHFAALVEHADGNPVAGACAAHAVEMGALVKDEPPAEQTWQCDQCGATVRHGDSWTQERVSRGDYRCPNHANANRSCDGLMRWQPSAERKCPSCFRVLGEGPCSACTTEPPAEQAACDITTFAPDGRPHRESQNGSCYCDACCVKAGLAPAEQPSRQETGVGETCKVWCGFDGSDGDVVCMFDEERHSPPCVAGDRECVCRCSQACIGRRDRAKAKAAEQAPGWHDDCPVSPCGDAGCPATKPAEPSGTGQLPRAAVGLLRRLDPDESYKTEDDFVADFLEQQATLQALIGGYGVALVDSGYLRRHIARRAVEPPAPAAGTLSPESMLMGHQQAALLRRIDELHLKLAQAQRDLVGMNGIVTEQQATLAQAERERDEWHAKYESQRLEVLRWQDREEELLVLRRERDEATAKERERCLAWYVRAPTLIGLGDCIRSGKPVPGTDKPTPKRDPADGMTRGEVGEMLDRHRAAKCDPEPPREVAPDRTQAGSGGMYVCRGCDRSPCICTMISNVTRNWRGR